MKKIIAALSLVGASLFGEVTPNVPDGTPVWADDNDIHVAYVIMGEARGESLFCQAMVADTIYTRMINRSKSAYEIVIEPNQFAGYFDGHVTDHVWKLVRKLKVGLDIIPYIAKPHFRAHKIIPMPNWGKDSIIVGGHIYFDE